MKHKFLKDLGIEIDDETLKNLRQFDLNGLMDEITDNRLNEDGENKNEETTSSNKEE